MTYAQTPPLVDSPGGGVTQKLRWYSHFLANISFSTNADTAEWLLTHDNATSSVTIADANPNGVLRITPGTSANDYKSLQLNGEAFGLYAGRNQTIKTRIRTNDADDIKFFIGLASSDTTGTTAGPILDGTNDSIGFRNVAGNTAAFLCVTEDDTTETTNTAGTLADDTWTDLRIDIYGTSRVVFLVNGVQVADHRTNLPDSAAGLTLTIEVGSPTGTTATYLDLDYLEIEADSVSV